MALLADTGSAEFASLWDLAGQWSLARRIRHADGCENSFTGQAVFTRSGTRLIQEESGLLRLDDQSLEARQRLVWNQDGPLLKVHFADMRPFPGRGRRPRGGPRLPAGPVPCRLRLCPMADLEQRLDRDRTTQGLRHELHLHAHLRQVATNVSSDAGSFPRSCRDRGGPIDVCTSSSAANAPLRTRTRRRAVSLDGKTAAAPSAVGRAHLVGGRVSTLSRTPEPPACASSPCAINVSHGMRAPTES